MKSFIRSLNIEERKTLIYGISYSVAKTISALLIKVFSTQYETDSLTVLCERGCLLSIICFSRILYIIKNNKQKRDSILNLNNYTNLLLRSILNCLSFSLMVFSIYNCDMSKYFIITRQSPLITIFISQFVFNTKMKKFQIFGWILDIIGLCFILLPQLFEENSEGILYAIIVMCILSISEILNKHLIQMNVDILILFTGVYSAAFGCFTLILNNGQFDKLNFLQWILIFLNAIFTYYAILFQTVAMKRTRNNWSTLFPFTLISIVLTLFFELLFFNLKLGINDVIGYFIIIINTVLFTSKAIKNSKKLKIRNNYYIDQ